MITKLTEQVIGVTVPEGATKFYVWEKKNQLQYFEGELPIYNLIELSPEHSWTLIGKASELRNKDWLALDMAWLQIGATVGYKDYSIVDDLRYPFPTALESGLSLLKKHNLNPETTIILKKQ